MSRAATPTAVDIAIVNWNTAEAALAAASAYLSSEEVDARVTIADNASTPEQQRLLRERCPQGATLELNRENLGYGTAANRALSDGDGKVVCVSNADSLPAPSAVTELAAVACEEPGAGMVGPVFDGATGHYHAKLPGAMAMLGRIFAGSFMRGAVESPKPGEVEEVGQPSGACFAVRRETWERVGGFDEGFFLWYEDVDLAKRLHDAGYRNLLVGAARVNHAGAQSFSQLDRRRQQALRLAAVRRYIRRHHRWMSPIAAPLLRLSAWARAGGERHA